MRQCPAKIKQVGRGEQNRRRQAHAKARYYSAYSPQAPWNHAARAASVSFRVWNSAWRFARAKSSQQPGEMFYDALRDEVLEKSTKVRHG